MYKGFPWFTEWFWQIGFDLTTVPNGDSGKSGLKLQLFPMETIVTSNMIGQNNTINQWKCFIQLSAVRFTLVLSHTFFVDNFFFYSLLHHAENYMICVILNVPRNKISVDFDKRQRISPLIPIAKIAHFWCHKVVKCDQF